jgi:membrane fusion protein, copper/silver efflux system
MSVMRKTLEVAVPVVLIAGVVLAVVFWPRGKTDEVASQGEWTCSMHPQVRLPGPGKCPICGMDLVPVERLASERARIEQTGGMEAEPVGYRELSKEVRTVGKLDYNEPRIAYITARVAGRVDRVHADFTGIQVKKDDHLVDIYAPDLVVTVQNLRDAIKSGNNGLADVARDRLRLWGVLPEQIAEIEKSQEAKSHLIVYAPIGGTVIEKTVRPGQYVKEGDSLYRIADLDPIWLYLDVYEYDLAWVRYGQQVDVTLEAYPGEQYRGTVTFIDPFLDDKSRTVRVRVNLKNPERKLKPAMYASAVIRARLRPDGSAELTGLEGKYICPMRPEVIRDGPGKCPVCEMALERVPDLRPVRPPVKDDHAHHGHDHAAPPPDAAEPPPGQVLAVRAIAVLNTGRRTIVYRKWPDGAYELVELVVGPLAEGKDDAGRVAAYYPVLKGLKPGDRVVVRGGFLLDSQRQIEGMPSLLFPEGQGRANLHAGHGGPPPAAPPGEGHKH